MPDSTAQFEAFKAERIAARRRAAMQNIAARLLAENGSVTQAEVDEALDAEVQPDEAVLRDEFAAKLESAIAYHRQVEADVAAEVDSIEAKVVKLEGHLAEARETLERLREASGQKVADAEQAAEQAQATLDDMRAQGAEPARVETDTAAVDAEAAEAKASD